MKNRISRGWIAFLLIVFSANAFTVSAQQSGTPAHIRFIFENPKLQPAHYVIDVDEAGKGHFQSEPGSAAPPDAEGITPQSMEVAIQIDEPLRAFLFKTARSHNFFNTACESTKDKVAFTGKKVLQYTGSDGNGACTFNWSRDQQLMKLSEDFIAVAYTLEVGRRLSVEHEHSRLSLDAELEGLQDAAKAGRAQQIVNINPQLEAIAADEQVLSRARQRAHQLMGKARPD